MSELANRKDSNMSYFQLKQSYYKTINVKEGNLAQEQQEDPSIIKEILTEFAKDKKEKQNEKLLEYLLKCFPLNDFVREALSSLGLLYDSLPMIQFLLKTGYQKSYHRCLLYDAIRRGCSKIPRYLTTNYSEQYLLSDIGLGYETMKIAAEARKTELASKILNLLENKGVNIFNLRPQDASDDLGSLWISALRSDDVNFIKLLINKGLDVNKPIFSEFNISPLQLAIHDLIEPEIISFLASQGADVNFLSSEEKNGYFSPLSAVTVSACRYGLYTDFLGEATKILVKYGANHLEENKTTKNTAHKLMIKTIHQYYDDPERVPYGDPEEGEMERKARKKKEDVQEADRIFQQAIEEGLELRAKVA